MNSNFTFLHDEFPTFYTEMVEAEKFAFIAPRYSVVLCRTVLEKAVFWLYQNDETLVLPFETKLAALLFTDSFKVLVPEQIFHEIDLVRRYGNNGAHGKKVKQLDALHAVKNTFRFLSWVSKYYSISNPDIPAFDERYIPYGDIAEKSQKIIDELSSLNQKQQKDAEIQLKKNLQLAEENELLKQQIQEHQKEISARKQERKEHYHNSVDVPPLTSEMETRKLLIDILLQEAGWREFKKGYDIEFEVSGMPLSTNPSGIGYVDYVLWDDNGKPLAVVEAKKTLYDAVKGRHQAFLYANCLESKFGQRPVIFYSNGFETFIWDDKFYPERKISGFYTKNELQTLIRRRTERQDLRNFEVNKSIAGRPYQLQAIKRISETFVTVQNGILRGKNRKALLVMATGSGKTRTAAALVDMLTKCNWAKRILFLADRNALVTQAKNEFKKHLPNLSAIDLTKEKDNTEARIVFSTYPTIMNKIDDARSENAKLYSPGHFDLVIIDEAHRSVYQKYQAIFNYFDALLIGLTATPKKDIDRNTYHLFEIEDDIPTFAYELNEAVEQKYLVPPKAYDVPVKFPRQGIKYSELSEKDKNHFEELFGIEAEDKEDELLIIPKSKINSFLFNVNTVDLVLDHLMREGLHIEEGDKLGKTIIFAKNHRHALFIEERFNKNYPEYGGTFLRVIDNYEDKSQDLLERFCNDKGVELEPQIAVSVDMMDTGVDAPRVLNLVFFKEVKSFSKFWQMIGRGTRLCPNIFGQGRDKEFFLIFDICGVLEFFEQNPDGYNGSTQVSLQQKLFDAQLEIIFTIVSNSDSTSDELEFAKEYTDELHAKIMALDESRFQVRKHLKYVQFYKNRANWDNLNNSKILEIQQNLSHLISYTDDKDEMAKKFDLLVYRLELAIVKCDKKQNSLTNNIISLSHALLKKRNIASVQQKISVLEDVVSGNFWSVVTLKKLENLRIDLRNLMQLLQDENKETPVYSYLQDELNTAMVKEVDLLKNYTTSQSYKDRVESFIKKHRDHLVIDKLYRNIPITPSELKMLEKFLTHEKFSLTEIEKEYDTKSLGIFVRKVLGLDIKAVQMHFSGFIQEENLNANQIIFVQKIIDYLNRNGVLDKQMLTEPPFTELDDQGLFGIFEDEERCARVINLVEAISRNAETA